MTIIFAWILASRYSKVHADLEQSHSDLLVLDKMKDDFLATTSHELRTPLHGIMGLSDAIADGSLGKVNRKQLESIGLIRQSAAQLNSLVNDILDFSKIRAGRADIIVSEIALDDVIRTVVSIVKTTVPESVVRFETDIGPLPRINADAARVRQVLINLIGNAVKFTDRGVIKVSARQQGSDAVSVSVSDTGIGIDPKDLNRIFSPFEQAEDPNTRKAGGSGLGLAITKQLVELHGGTIKAQSSKGEGSTFTFTLPVTPQLRGIGTGERAVGSVVLDGSRVVRKDPAYAENEAMVDDIDIHSSATVLAVDDDETNLRVIHNVCARAGYRIITARTGPEALKILTEQDVDLVLLDLMLPGMSGFEVCQEIRKMGIGRYVPVIMVTARDQVSDLVTGFKTGANDYLTKPFNRNELLMRMESQLAIKYMLDMERSVINGLQKQKDNISDLFRRSVDLKESTLQMVKWEHIIREDLDIAHSFQLKLMTHQRDIPGLDSYIHYDPLLKIGGDIYDIAELRPGKTRVFMADATGHGISASLNTVKILSEYAAVKDVMDTPAELVTHLNRRFFQFFKDYQIIFTCVVADIDTLANTLCIVTAGQPEQYLLQDIMVPLKLHGPIIGLTDAAQYYDKTYSFTPGSALFLFSDGMFEYFPFNQNLQLGELLEGSGIFTGIMEKGVSAMSAKEMMESAINFARTKGRTDQIDDDITLIIVKRVE